MGPWRWKVFLSHTKELREYPEGERSFVNQAERAVSACGHVIVDMADFPALDQVPAEVCVERVRACDVYVGLFGMRYGSPVRGQPSRSYTELEFDTASEAGLPRLIFIVDPSSTQSGLPLDAGADHRYGERQETFLRRVRDSGLTVQSFRNPDDLRDKVSQALRALAATGPRVPAAAKGSPQPPLLSRPEAFSRQASFSRPVPELLAYLPDRQRQEEMMGILMDRLTEKNPTGPLVVILHGNEDQEVDRYRERFLQHSAISRYGNPVAIRDFALHWPEECKPGIAFSDLFRQRLSQVLKENTELKSLESLLREKSDPVVLWSCSYTSFRDGNIIKCIDSICDFWHKTEQFANTRLIHWITINYTLPSQYPKKKILIRWLEVNFWRHWYTQHLLGKHNARVRAKLKTMEAHSVQNFSPQVLPELRSINRAEADLWAKSKDVENFLGTSGKQWLVDRIRDYYREQKKRFKREEIPLEELAEIIKELLEEGVAKHP